MVGKRPNLESAFGHHIWATDVLLDACCKLTLDQIFLEQPGVFGSVMATMRHIADGDLFFLGILCPELLVHTVVDDMNLEEVRKVLAHVARVWQVYLSQDWDPGTQIRERESNGYARDASISIGLVQALHHGTDHRSQVCTMLSRLGVEPPIIDGWEFGLQRGLIRENFPSK